MVVAKRLHLYEPCLELDGAFEGVSDRRGADDSRVQLLELLGVGVAVDVRRHFELVVSGVTLGEARDVEDSGGGGDTVTALVRLFGPSAGVGFVPGERGSIPREQLLLKQRD